jgi:adenosylcobinamide-GDP ribazoletransferase
MSKKPPNRHRFGATGLASALSLLTVAGTGAPPRPSALTWFPLVGATVGASVGLVWWGSSNVWPLFVAAGLALTADLVLTGFLHLDGLADSADGLLPHLDRERRLAVMAEPGVGAFAVATVGVVLLLRLGGILALPESAKAVALVAAIWAASRTLMAVAIDVLPSARPGSMATMFGGGSSLPAVALGVPLAVLLAVIGRGLVGLAALAIGVTVGVTVLALARRRIGGCTGDVLGAAGILTETAALLTAAARW